MAGVTGDFAGLADLREAIHKAGHPQFKAGLGQVMGVAGMKVLNDSFRNSVDPYGQQWKPLALRAGKPLLDTGRLRASAALVPIESGFRIDISAPYATTHQYGAHIVPRRARMLAWQTRGAAGRRRGGRWFFAKAVTIPRRQMLPEAATGGLGPIWTKALSKAAERFVTRWFEGGGAP